MQIAGARGCARQRRNLVNFFMNHPMAESERKKILFYCQSLVGLGHLTSSLKVIRELSRFADVDFLYGGLMNSAIDLGSGCRYQRLPTVLIHPESGDLYDPEGKFSLAELWVAREASIRDFLRPRYDAVIVEFFPFGRRRFKREILDLFGVVRDRSGPIPIFTFIREVLVPEPPDAEQRMVRNVNDYIHTIFVRGDPNVVRFEETFAQTDAIRDKIVYVGYVAPPSPSQWPERQRKILVSQGGGEIGRELLEAAIRVAPHFSDYRFKVVMGSQTTEQIAQRFRQMVASQNVEVVPFLANFTEDLAESALSISLGGDNTLMDVISTRVPALAFPYPGNTEQALRIEKLARKGFVTPLTPDDLPAERFKVKIAAALEAPYPEASIATNGAAVMSDHIRKILNAG